MTAGFSLSEKGTCMDQIASWTKESGSFILCAWGQEEKRKTKLNKNDQEKACAHGSVNQYNHFAKLAVSTNSEHMHTHACMLSH